MYAGDGVKNFIFLCCCTAELYTNSGAAELPHALISASRLRVDCDVEDSCMLLASPFFNFGASVHLNLHIVRSGRDGMRDSIATAT